MFCATDPHFALFLSYLLLPRLCTLPGQLLRLGVMEIVGKGKRKPECVGHGGGDQEYLLGVVSIFGGANQGPNCGPMCSLASCTS